jgi:hypothetical protein
MNSLDFSAVVLLPSEPLSNNIPTRLYRRPTNTMQTGAPEIGTILQDFDKFCLDDTKPPATQTEQKDGCTLSLLESDFKVNIAPSGTSSRSSAKNFASSCKSYPVASELALAESAAGKPPGKLIGRFPGLSTLI